MSSRLRAMALVIIGGCLAAAGVAVRDWPGLGSAAAVVLAAAGAAVAALPLIADWLDRRPGEPSGDGTPSVDQAGDGNVYAEDLTDSQALPDPAEGTEGRMVPDPGLVPEDQTVAAILADPDAPIPYVPTIPDLTDADVAGRFARIVWGDTLAAFAAIVEADRARAVQTKPEEQ